MTDRPRSAQFPSLHLLALSARLPRAAVWLLAACAALALAADAEEAQRIGAAESSRPAQIRGASALIGSERAPSWPRMQRGISLRDAATITRQAYGGRVVSVRPAMMHGRLGYRVRVDVSGTVKTVFVDSLGRILEYAR